MQETSNLFEKKEEMYCLTSQQEGNMGLAEIRDWRAIDFLHSFSDQLFYQAGDLCATSYGFIVFKALRREKRAAFHAAPVEITRGRTLKDLR